MRTHEKAGADDGAFLQIDLFTPKISAETAHRLHKALKPNGRTGFTERINMTFRFYRPDFTPEAANDSYPSLPRCRCEGRPLCVLRPDMKGKLSPDASTPYVSLLFSKIEAKAC